MNDPHVEKLFYRIEKREGINFKDGVSPVTVTNDIYTISMDASEAAVTMTAHFPSVEEAGALVEPFLEKWEFWDDLHERNGFRFRYKNARLTDRNPPPAAAREPDRAPRSEAGACGVALFAPQQAS